MIAEAKRRKKVNSGRKRQGEDLPSPSVKAGQPPMKKPKKNNKFKFPENVKPKPPPPSSTIQVEEEKPAEEEEPAAAAAPLEPPPLEPPTPPVLAKPKVTWNNRQRVLIFSSRGIKAQYRHLMLNLRSLLPHSKSESKRDDKAPLFAINELCEQKSCNKCLYFTSKKQDLFLWAANVPSGPSAKFLVENASTMEEIKLLGNCLRGSHALISFDKSFEELPQYALVKELFVQIFATPRGHPHSQPCVDHILTFTLLDNRIWFRNYQILGDGGKKLEEIGPRMVLNLVKICSGSFEGSSLYSNPHYKKLRQQRKLMTPWTVDSSSSDEEDQS